ncbi:Hypothetical Protein FCC1311_055212 [Hondaea fermentalgiana]|uniref:N-acetyltransferase domain-containing protein n=1 Tax=Hondaea fermentalgiana TaxID=2315210 RepID=A0A2R5GG41_9STRA|nr:Hypothetical Protein FCC1311_055212 [Hondaea fermentalgiana]|eukprot:GBG29299.1 Hypothetical Protein FCC1311_055212 [Hondaea fermentalgiana]
MAESAQAASRTATSWRVSRPQDAENEVVVDALVTIINAAYSRGEEGMWRNPATERTNPEEVKKLLLAEELILIFSKEDDEEDETILGSVMCKAPFKKDNEELAELGMLAVAENATGLGLGSQLIEAAETHARSKGCTIMRLEILSPAEYVHPFKQRLHKWYCRLGYEPGPVEDFKESYPALADLLAVKCKFQVYHKPLVAPASSA